MLPPKIPTSKVIQNSIADIYYQMSSLDYILYSLILVLLVVYISLGRQDIREGYTPTIRIEDDDSDLVVFLKYVYYFASVIAYFVIKWPYQMITILIRIPINFTYDMFLAIKPIVNTMVDMYRTVMDSMAAAMRTMFDTVKEMFNVVKDIPGLMLSMSMQFVQMAQSIFGMFGGVVDMMKSMMSFMMTLPTQMFNMFKTFTNFVLKFPLMLMKIPTAGMNMMMSYTDQFNNMLDHYSNDNSNNRY